MRPSTMRRRRVTLLAAALLLAGLAVWMMRGAGADTATPPLVSGPFTPGSAGGDSGPTSAAVRFLVALGDASIEPDRRAEALAMIAPTAGELIRQASAGLTQLDGELATARQSVPNGRLLTRMVPVVYRTTGCTPQRCQVSVWTLGIVAIEGRSEATKTWQTNIIDLQHNSSSWQVVGWQVVAGPVPTITARRPTPTAELLSTIEGWESFDHVAID